MGKHAKPCRAVLLARTGACGGAALALSAAGLFTPAPALADGTPPGEVVSTSEAKPAKKASKAGKVNKAGKASQAKKAKKANTNAVESGSVDPENEFEQSIEQDAENASRNVNGLVNLAGNNVQLIAQACNNFVPVNGVGGQVAGEALAGAAGAVAEGTGAGAENSKDCEQLGAQLDGDDGVAGSAGERNVNGLVNVSDNNVQVPVQACNNFVPVNGVGGQVAGEELTGALGVLGNDTEVERAENGKDCTQGSEQDDSDDAGDGERSTNGLVNVSDNNVQVPLQGCNNYVPVNAVGGQVTGEEVTGALGLLAGDTRAGSSSSKDCDQDSTQEDDD